MDIEPLLNSRGVMGIYPYCDSFPVQLLCTKPFTCLWELMPCLNSGRFKISRGNFCLLCSSSEHISQKAMGLALGHPCKGCKDLGPVADSWLWRHPWVSTIPNIVKFYKLQSWRRVTISMSFQFLYFSGKMAKEISASQNTAATDGNFK